MTRLLVVVAAFVSLTALTREPTVRTAADSSATFTFAVAAAQADPATITVYITKTGEKYHRDGCRFLSRSRIPMPLKEAVKRFEPCKVCRPPLMSTR
jgi:hypothetical protein